MRNLLLSGLLVLMFSPLAGWADNVFISNKPYKGQLYGVGNDIRFPIEEIARALGLRVDQTPEGWFLAGSRINTTEELGVVWVRLDALPNDRVRVVRNKEFNTVDLYRVGSKGDFQPKTWGGEATLVFFGASWDPHTSSMLSTISELERSQSVRVVYVDVENNRSASFREFAYLFEGDKIPFFVLLDGDGVKLHSFFGHQTYNGLMSILGRHLWTDR